MELLPSLLAGLRAVCAGFPDPRKGRRGNIAMADFGLSAFALFFMQSASFLAFQRGLEKGQGRSNCQTLFGIEKIPSDNYIRDMLDAADPALLQPCFERMEQMLAAPPLRAAFGRLGERTLIARGHSKRAPLFPNSSRRKTARKRRTANVTLSSAGTPSTANGFPRCAPSISATICSPASRSSQC